ncbi:hypothetical protein OF83DRAFT_188553 [Amylostereum chailletii]|nr:hypothetical protein OF83DRAFT_188553 [Amylostereum chailletii]
MSDPKKRNSSGNDRSKKRYRSDGSPIWGKRVIDGPGVWVSCVKGKEKQTVGELYDLFEMIATELWPEPGPTALAEADADDADEDGEEEDLEKQIAKELASMKRPRREQRFVNCQTNTPCVVFIACKLPVDPVQLVVKHIENVENTGVTHTRFTQRLTPVVNTCVANPPEIKSLFLRVLNASQPDAEVSEPTRKYRYKVELRTRNHNTHSRQTIIDAIVACVPEGWAVDLEDPEIFVLVEVFKSVCGISIVRDYYEHQKFNVMGIANVKNGEGKFKEGEGRVGNARAGEGVDPS